MWHHDTALHRISSNSSLLLLLFLRTARRFQLQWEDVVAPLSPPISFYLRLTAETQQVDRLLSAPTRRIVSKKGARLDIATYGYPTQNSIESLSTMISLFASLIPLCKSMTVRFNLSSTTNPLFQVREMTC